MAVKIIRFLILFRIPESLLITGFFMIGAFFSIQNIDIAGLIKLSVFAAGAFFLTLSFYAFNSVCGYSHDIENPRLSYVRGNPRQLYSIATAIFLVLSLILLAPLHTAMAPLGLLVFILWCFYSMPKGLKYIPLGGTALHVTVQIPQFIMGYILFSGFSEKSVLIALYFGLIFAGGHLHHEIIDHEADRDSGIMSGSVFFGKAKSLFICRAIFAVAFIYLAVLWQTGFVKASEALPFMSVFVWQMVTDMLLRLGGKTESARFILNRHLYRAYFLSAGAVFFVLKLLELSGG